MKRNFKIVCASLLAGLALFPFVSCGNKAGDMAEDFQISLNETMLEMNVGETYELKVTISPDDPVEKRVDWSSSDEGVASVEKGTVTAKSEGETVITATSNGVSDTCKVTVRPSQAEEDNIPDQENGNSNDEMPGGTTPENGPEGK